MDEIKRNTKKLIWIPGGANQIWVDLGNALQKINPRWEVVLVVPEKKFDPDFRVEVLDSYIISTKVVYVFDYLKNIVKRNRKPDTLKRRYFRHLEEFLDREKPDVILTHVYSQGFTKQVARWSKKHKTPFVLLERKRESRGRFRDLLVFTMYRNIFRRAALILCWTKQGVQFGRENFPVKDNKKIDRITAGVDPRLFYPSRENMKQKDGLVRFLIVARLIPFKRHTDLLKAFAQAKKENREIKLTILGEGPLLPDIKGEVTALDIETSVEFLRNVPYKEMVRVFHEHDCIVLPSDNENIGMVIPEAMASGLPAIVSDHVGAKDYVRDGVDGLIFESGNIDQLAESILLMASKKKCATMGERASRNLHENYTNTVTAKALNENLSRIM